MKKLATLLLLVFYLFNTLGYCLLESRHQLMHLFPQLSHHEKVAHGHHHHDHGDHYHHHEQEHHHDGHHGVSDHHQVLKILGEQTTDAQDETALAILFSYFTFVKPELDYTLIPKIEQVHLKIISPVASPQNRSIIPPTPPPRFNPYLI